MELLSHILFLVQAGVVLSILTVGQNKLSRAPDWAG